MFKFLRSKAKIFYWVIAASFIAFIFLAWGMDFRGNQSRGRGGGSTVGKVNGVEIPASAWSRAYQQTVAQLRQQTPDRTLTANQIAEASDRAWDQLVRGIIVDQEIERLGITATDEEVLDTFRNNPPPELLAGYVDESGQPDLARYYADLQNPARDWSRAEQYIRATLPQRKLQQLITAGAVVSDAEVHEAYVRQTGRAVAEWIGVLYADLGSEYEPTDDAIEAYYQANLGKYHREEQAHAYVVSWPKEPSPLDYDEVRRDLEEVRDEIVTGERTFAEAAELYSQDGTAESGGDLGTFDRRRMVPAFSDAAFSLPVGQVSEPVKTQFGYHLIEVLEHVVDESGELEKVRARHILFRVDPSSETLGEIYERAVAFRERVTADVFVETAKAESLQVYDPPPFFRGRDIPGLKLSVSGSNYAFRAEAGEIGPVLENDDAFYLVLADGTTPAGPAPLEQVRSQVVVELKREHDRGLAEAKLSPAVGKAQLGQSLASVAAEYDLAHGVTDTLTAASNVADVGYGTAFNEVALAAPVGTLVPEVATLRGLYAVQPLWQQQFSAEDFSARSDAIRASLLARKQNSLLDDWFAQKLAAAEIVDLRDEARQGT
jgi:peptidyl-prolyl cis-trans isomerase D